MGPCGNCWGGGEVPLVEMGDDRTIAGWRPCSHCKGSGIEPPPLPELVFVIDDDGIDDHPEDWDDI